MYSIIGWMGQAFDELLTKRSKRKCTLVGAMDTGRKDANGTYDGCLGYLQANKASVLFRGECEF